MGKLNGARPNCTRTALHENSSPLDRTRDMDCAMSSDSGNSQTGTLLQRNTFGERNNLFQSNCGVLCGSSKWSVRLSAIAPHATPDPFPRHIFSHGVNSTRAIAVRYDARVRHANSKSILTFLHITWIYPGKGNANPHLARAGIRVVHLTNNQNITGSTLPFVPGSFHR
jgi:hypothetical protein